MSKASRAIATVLLAPMLAQCAYISDAPIIPTRAAESCGPLAGSWSVIQNNKNGGAVQSGRWVITPTKKGCHFRSTALDTARGAALKGDIDEVGFFAASEIQPNLIAVQFLNEKVETGVKNGRYIYAYAVRQSIDNRPGYFLLAPKCAVTNGCVIESMNDLKTAILANKSNPDPNLVAILQAN